MGKRYYCDYCDKTFADNPQNRKKHLQGVFHDRLRKLHYSHFREPEVILGEELSKPPCKKLQQQGFCPFEGSCRFSHMTPQWERELQEKIDAKNKADRAAKELAASQPEPSVEDWLTKRAKRRKKNTESASTEGGGPDEGMVLLNDMQFTLPAELCHVPDLPPSLIPPTADCFTKVAEWGS